MRQREKREGEAEDGGDKVGRRKCAGKDQKGGRKEERERGGSEEGRKIVFNLKFDAGR